MVPEVRFVPPRPVAWLAVGLFLWTAFPCFSQENKASEENQDSVAAKARLLQELDRQIEQRRQRSDREAHGLDASRRALEMVRKALVEESGRLETLQKEVQADIARREKLVDERLGQIAKVYAAMKPREAASALAGLDDPTALAILVRLPGRTVGKMFDLMGKDRVRELTRLLEEGRAVKRE